MVLDEFLYRIGFDVDSGKIKQIELGLKNIAAAAKGVAQPIADGINAATAKNAELIGNLDQAVQGAKEWGEATKAKASEAAAALNEVAQAEKEVAKNAEEAAKKTAKVADKKPVKGLKQEIDELKNKFFLVGVAATAVSGLIANYVKAPLENIQEFAKEKNKLFAITQAEITQAKEYQDRLKDTKTALHSITTQVALKLIPTVNQSLIGFTNFLKANKALVVEGLANVFKWILKLGQVFTNTFRFLNKVISSTIGWKAALLILVGVLAVVKRAMLAAFLTNPIGWVIMLIGGLILLIDDLMVYLDGGKSALGDFWKPFIEWGKKAIAWFESVKPDIMRVLGGIGATIWGFIRSAVGGFKILAGAFTLNFDLMRDGLEEWVDGGAEMLDGLLQIFNTSWSEIVAWFVGLYNEYVKPIIDEVQKAVNFIKDGWGKIGGKASDIWNGAKNILGFGDDTPKAALAMQAASNNRTNNYKGGDITNTYNITTQNPQMAGSIIEKQNKLNLAAAYYNMGGD